MSHRELGDPPSVVAHAWGPWGLTEAPSVQNYFQNYTKVSFVLFTVLCVKRVLGETAGGIFADIHNHHTFAVKRMQVSPQNVPDEVMQIHFLRTQSRGMHLFNILVTKWKSSERFRCTRRLCQGEHLCESCELKQRLLCGPPCWREGMMDTACN